MTDQDTNGKTADSPWKSLYRIGAVAALIVVAMIPVQSFLFIAYPPPETVLGYFTLFQDNWLLGLLAFDLLYLIDNTLLILLFLALYAALRRTSQSLMAIALTISLVGIATYYSSNPGFEMLSLSSQYAAATTNAQRALFLAAGQGMLASYTGTAYDVYYVLNAAALLLIAMVMLRSRIFSKATAYIGLLAGGLMIIPASAGIIGMAFAFASLLPWAIFSVLIALRLFRLGSGGVQETG
ncbi:hypothetical protein ACFL45_07195 [Candidatus Neomarinimicrobiota bacterium]